MHPLSWVLTIASVPRMVMATLPSSVTASQEMVASAHPLATEAGLKVLERGGTAADAMIAVQTVLGLVEPAESGIGGGAFFVYYDAATDETTTLDARETAPAAATVDRFSGLSFAQRWQSGLSVGVPGVPRLMENAHDRFGKLQWRSLFQDAIDLARNGFPLDHHASDRVRELLELNPTCNDGDRLYFRDPTAFEYFVDKDTCSAKPAGTILTNNDYADLMEALAEVGAKAFYEGEIAEDIAHAVQNDLHIQGDMTVEDLRNYNVEERTPVCFEYKTRTACGIAPPSSGTTGVGQILGLLENFDLTDKDPHDVDVVHLFTQAGRLAFADRGKYVGDSSFITVPVEGMLNPDYLTSRAELIDADGDDMGKADWGVPPGEFDPLAPDMSAPTTGTSHISIVDKYGNALSMTTSIESSFGNGVMVHGFLLTNQLTDFSKYATYQGEPGVNRVEPGKRPRSSMAPLIIFNQEGKVELVVGAAGGSRIIGYVAQTVMNILDFGLNPQEAMNFPHYTNRNMNSVQTEIELPIAGVTPEYDAEALKAALEARGHVVTIGKLKSGLSGILVNTETGELKGGADTRRDGSVMGN